MAYLAGHWNEYAPKGGLLSAAGARCAPSLRVPDEPRQLLDDCRALVLQPVCVAVEWLHGWLRCPVRRARPAPVREGCCLPGSPPTSTAATCALGIVAALKNEGTLFAFCTIAALVAVIGPRQLAHAAARSRTEPRLLLVPCLAILPVLLWALRKAAWGLRNDMTGDVAGAIARVASRLSDGTSPQYVFKYLTVRESDVWVAGAALVPLIAFALAKRFTIPRGTLLAAATATFYFVALYLAYLSTPLGLQLSPVDLRDPHDGRRPHRGPHRGVFHDVGFRSSRSDGTASGFRG